MSKRKNSPIGALRYLYLGTSNIQKDLDYYTKVLEAKKLWDLSSFGTRVAALRLGEGPFILLADHRPSPSCIMIYEVDDLKQASGSFEREAGNLWVNNSRSPKAHVTGSMIQAATHLPYYKLQDPTYSEISVTRSREVLDYFLGRGMS